MSDDFGSFSMSSNPRRALIEGALSEDLVYFICSPVVDVNLGLAVKEYGVETFGLSVTIFSLIATNLGLMVLFCIEYCW